MIEVESLDILSGLLTYNLLKYWGCRLFYPMFLNFVVVILQEMLYNDLVMNPMIGAAFT